MKYLKLIVCMLLPTYLFSQRIGVNLSNPTITLDVNGSMRLRSAPDSTENYQFVNELGDQELGNDFKPTRTLVSQNDGMLGYVDGVGLTENPDYDYIRFTKVITDDLNNDTPLESIVEIGGIRVRLNTRNPYGTPNIQVAFLQRSQFGYFGTKQGKGRNNFNRPVSRLGRWSSDAMHRQEVFRESNGPYDWQDIWPDPNVRNEDFFTALVVKYNSPQEVYRISVLVNNEIPRLGNIPEVPPSVTIFVEQIE